MAKLSITNWRIERLHAILSIYPSFAVRIHGKATTAIDLVISHVDCVAGQKKNPFTNVSLSASRARREESSIISPRFIIAHPLTTPRFSFVHYFSPWPSSAFHPRIASHPRAPIVPPF